MSFKRVSLCVSLRLLQPPENIYVAFKFKFVLHFIMREQNKLVGEEGCFEKQTLTGESPLQVDGEELRHYHVTFGMHS